MSQANETSTETIFTREDGTQYTLEPFKLSKTKEIADRYRGDHTVNIPLPVAVKGDIDATLKNFAAFVAEGADLSEVLVGKVNGQGIRLDIQKEVKDFLAPRGTDDGETIEVDGEQVLVREAPVEAVLAHAQTVAMDFRLGAPRKRGSGAAKGKVAQAEAKAAKAVSTAVEMYKALPAELRAQYREALLATGNVTAEELDAVDNPQEGAGDEAPARGRGKR